MKIGSPLFSVPIIENDMMTEQGPRLKYYWLRVACKKALSFFGMHSRARKIELYAVIPMNKIIMVEGRIVCHPAIARQLYAQAEDAALSGGTE